MTAPASIILDSARAAKEVSMLVALTLIQTQGDADAALALLKEIAHVAPPRSVEELDAVAIGAQAIREALVLRS
jgi:hypothetical protein